MEAEPSVRQALIARLRRALALERDMFEGVPMKTTDDAARTLLSYVQGGLAEESDCLDEAMTDAYEKVMRLFPD